MRRGFQCLVALASAVTVVVVVAAPGPVAVAATEGQRLESHTTYRVDPLSGLVHVAAAYTVTNIKPNETTDTGLVEYYFTDLRAPVDGGATDIVVTVDGVPTARSIEPVADPSSRFDIVVVEYGRRLRYQQTTQVLIRYELAGRPPRSESPDRVNPAYTAFFASAFADPGLAGIRIEVPAGWQALYVGEDLQATPGDGVDVYSADAIADPATFAVLFTARHDAGLTSSPVETLDGHEFVIRSWPGDGEWKSFVRGLVVDGIPLLEAFIGQTWPERSTTAIVEAYTPYLRGYSGWYDPTTDVVEVGEQLDPQTVLHELGHAWFNSRRFVERWINEGLAEEFASKAVLELFGDPIDPAPVLGTDPAAVRLNHWPDPSGRPDADETETFGYHASFLVARALTDEIGMDAMRAVLAAIAAGAPAYPGDPGDPNDPGAPSDVAAQAPVDWKRFLDLVEEYGGSQTAETLLRTWVTDAAEAELLDERSAVRAAYHELDLAGGTWAPPLLVRDAMAAWDFPLARRGIEQATEALAHRAALSPLLTATGQPVDPALETAYEHEDRDLGSVTTRIDAEIGKVQGLQRSRAEAAEALARSEAERTQRAGRVGRSRAAKIAVASLASIALVAGLGLGVSRRRRRQRYRARPPDDRPLPRGEVPSERPPPDG